LYDAQVDGALMNNLNIENATIYNTNIGVGGEAPF